MQCARGFLPCFSLYKHSHFPIDTLYKNSAFVTRTKELLSNMVDCVNPINFAPGRDLQPIRHDSKESKRLISLFASPYQLYRIDYGNTKFKVIFGISNSDRIVYIYALDSNHDSYKQ